METLSGSYYAGKMRVEQYRNEKVKIGAPDFDTISYQLNTSENIILKINQRYFPAYRGSTVPGGTIALPMERCAEVDISVPGTEIVWVPKDQEFIRDYLW